MVARGEGRGGAGQEEGRGHQGSETTQCDTIMVGMSHAFIQTHSRAQGDGLLATPRSVRVRGQSHMRPPAGVLRREEAHAEGDVELSVLPAQLWSEPTAPAQKKGSLKGKKEDRRNPPAKRCCQAGALLCPQRLVLSRSLLGVPTLVIRVF